MARYPIDALEDIRAAAGHVRQLLKQRSKDDVARDVFTRAAFERFLEIISEASRHVPEAWKQEFRPGPDWRAIANLGNVLRHAYHETDLGFLWAIYMEHLTELEDHVSRMLAKYDTGEDD